MREKDSKNRTKKIELDFAVYEFLRQVHIPLICESWQVGSVSLCHLQYWIIMIFFLLLHFVLSTYLIKVQNIIRFLKKNQSITTARENGKI